MIVHVPSSRLAPAKQSRALRRLPGASAWQGAVSIDLNALTAALAGRVPDLWTAMSILAAGILIGALAEGMLTRRRLHADYQATGQLAANSQRILRERLFSMERDLAASRLQARRAEERLREELGRVAELADARARAETRMTVAEQQLSEQQVRCRELEARNAALGSELRDVSARLSGIEGETTAERRAIRERERLLQRTESALTEQLEALASRLYEDKGRAIRERAQADLESVVGPLRDQLRDFRARVDQAQVSETRERASLLNEIRALKSASDRANAEAANLARALKGDKRLQGVWGEMILERVLEDSGLTRGGEYRLQPVFRDADGELKRPDVVVRLPGGRDIVIDAKTSLVAWERAVAASHADDAGGSGADTWLDRFVADLRRQIKRLSAQSYESLPGLRSLDLTLLFIPVETALGAAMRRDPQLWSDAFSQRIVIVSPATLTLTLRIVERLWRSERQGSNVKEIAARAGAIYDKVRLVVDELERLGGHLQRAGNSYAEVRSRLRSGRGNLVRQVERLRELGAEVRRPIDESVGRDAIAEADIAPRLEIVPPDGDA